MKTTIDKKQLDGLETTLQDAHAAVTPKQRRVWPWIIVAQALFVALCYLSMPYFKTHLVFDKKAMEAEEAAVSERALAYRKEEKAKRTRREIHDEHADPLKKQEREQRRKSVLSQVDELKLIAGLMREKRDEEFSRLIDNSGEEDWSQYEARLKEALKKFSGSAEAIKKNETIDLKKEFDEASSTLLSWTEALRKQSDRTFEDREALTSRLFETETALKDLRVINKEDWTGNLEDESDDAQQVLSVLNPIQKQVSQSQKNVQSSEKRLDQKRDRTLDDIKRELDRLKQSHRSLLSQKNRSEKVAKLTDAIDVMQKSTHRLKSNDKWNQEELNKAFETINQSAGGAKERIQEIQALGDQRETQAMSSLLNIQQREADTQSNQWTQLKNKHTVESQKANRSATAAIDNANKQWAKTREQLSSEKREVHENSFTKLIEKARKQISDVAKNKSISPKAFKADADRLTKILNEASKDNPQAHQETGRLKQALDQLSDNLEQQAATVTRHTGENRNLAKRIRDEWRNAQKQLDDKARRVSPSLPKNPKTNSKIADLTKVAKGLENIQNDTRQMEKSGELQKQNIGTLLNDRSKALANLLKDTLKLSQTQRTQQNGIARNEGQKLDQSLNRLKGTLTRKHNEVVRQAEQHQKTTKQQEAVVQKSLDLIKMATGKTEALNSTDAKAITEMLKAAPNKASELVTDPGSNKALQEVVSKAKERTLEWLRKSNGQASKRQEVMAGADQALRELSEAMAEAGLTRQDADFAQSLLEEESPELEFPEPASLEEAIAATEELHDRIEDDFQSIRAADLATRTDQSLENMKRLAESFSGREKDIKVPNTETKIKTVGDLNRYRKAMDEAVADAESLTQNARTLQRQALGDNHPDLAKALQNAQLQGDGTPSLINVGPNPRRTKYRKGPNSVHQMTFDQMTGLRKKINFETVKAEALPGRRITGDSLRRGWLYVDTWYIIGPWENYGKIDWGNRHPPELEIDLARTYGGGKNNRDLRWQFTQHPALRCDVPDEQTNSSYYAYTELYFDEPREMLVAMASNDAGKLWIDNQVIWEDSGLSHWNLDESFQRIHFKKGFNKILMRVENGPAYCQFSLLLCPPDL